LHYATGRVIIVFMFFRKSSLRSKIIAGYIAGLLIILTFATFILTNLIFLEGRIRFFTVITRFVDTILEVRRYEKNYFLYRKRDDFEKALEYIDNAVKLMQENRKMFDAVQLGGAMAGDTLKSTSEIATQMLTEYRKLLQGTTSKEGGFTTLQAGVRRAGRDLTDLAEYLARSERQIINETIVFTQKSLIGAVVIFFAGTIFIAFLVSAIVIKPLKELELSMDNIASGRLEMLPISSEDKEIVSLKNAFERMIKEIFSQRDIIRSEKLTSLGTMLAGIAHEINNPLSNISTSAEILAEELSGGDMEFKRDLIDQIVQETDRARDIVRSVLEYTREKEFRIEPTNVSSLVSETMRFIRSDIPPHITVRIDVPENLSITVDKQKFQHSLLNILKNAIDAMSDRTREGKLTIGAHASDERWVTMEISDTGMGIDEDSLPKIFDPFFTTKDVGRGTGLGLFISHNIIEQHGGSIDVESTRGKGTTFTITLPAERREI